MYVHNEKYVHNYMNNLDLNNHDKYVNNEIN